MSALKRLARALGVTTGELIFEEHARGPDDELRLQFAAVAEFGPEEKNAAKDLLNALILKHQARRWTGTG